MEQPRSTTSGTTPQPVQVVRPHHQARGSICDLPSPSAQGEDYPCVTSEKGQSGDPDTHDEISQSRSVAGSMSWYSRVPVKTWNLALTTCSKINCVLEWKI